jgi:hypothetical protein
VVATLALWTPAERVMNERCGRLERGMNRAEVATILGGPPTSHSPGPDGEICVWEGDLRNYRIEITFDEDGHMCNERFHPGDPLVDRVHDWLIGQWHRWSPE